jgi:anti-anti-sigma factor
MRRAARVRLTGEFDLSEVHTFRETVTAGFVHDGYSVVLDLSEITFLDSSGLRAILEARHAALARGASLVLMGPSEAVEKVLELTGLTDVFDITMDDEPLVTD